ncbi:uncharacterized protein ACR2FA_003597 [Aphomia sociella]
MSYEPMDIDISNNSDVGMDISYESSDMNEPLIPNKSLYTSMIEENNSFEPVPHQQAHQNIKKFHIIIKKNDLKTRRTYILLSFFTVTCLSIFAYQVVNFQCYDGLNMDHLKEKLYSNIFGQKQALDTIIDTLSCDSEHKILLLYGGTGTGKTYTVSLLLENAWNDSNVYHYTMASFTKEFSMDLMIGLTLCKTAIFVIDDININNLNIERHVKSIIEKSKELGKNITVILIYNYTKDLLLDDVTFRKQLLHSFKDVNTLKQIVKFESLTEEHLKMCIKKELGDRKVNELEFQNIVKNFNVLLDGCKGVYKKMKFLNIVEGTTN